jgi:glucosamine--fructose-6-phosphate aminotransferase (isomerizing)
MATDGCTQALEYDLSRFAVFGASNSGRTKEVVRLVKKLVNAGHDAVFGLTATAESALDEAAQASHILACGREEAVAATKSVVEQALFYDSLLLALEGNELEGLTGAASVIGEALTMDIDPALVRRLSTAPTLYFAGRNDGVAEELALKTNEITRKKSDFLEGTYAVHGIEEVMNPDEAVVVIEPFELEEEKLREVLVEGVGLSVVAVASRNTSFPTVRIPSGGRYHSYVELVAGWNLLVEIGIALDIDLDNPLRARKVGNELIN